MTGSQRKTVLAMIVCLVLAIFAIYFFYYSAASRPVVIGFVGGLTGKAADLGIDCRRGVEMAISRINASGGVNGRMVELIATDDNQDEETARQAMKSLLALKLPVIIGHTTSSMTLATLPMIDKSSTLLVSPTTSTPLLTDIDDNFIRSCAESTAAATLMAKYLRKDQIIRKVGVIYDLGNKAYTEYWYGNFASTFMAAGGDSVEPFTFTSGPDARLLPLVEKVRQHDFDALVIVANSVDAAMLCQQIRKTGWQIPLALADWAATEQLISLGGETVEGAVISQFFNRKSTKPEYVDFKQEFERTYKSEPGFGALHAFNAATMVLEAIAGQHRNETIKEAILRISSFRGLQHDIVINGFGDSNHPTYMGVIENGVFNIIEDFH
jgi:branched-chain amino acid transport system substrate-binding protein